MYYTKNTFIIQVQYYMIAVVLSIIMIYINKKIWYIYSIMYNMSVLNIFEKIFKKSVDKGDE